MDADRLLAILHGTICAGVRADVKDLSARQMAILLVVGLDPGMHTVRGLAAMLMISKPAISRSLDRLCELGLAGRAFDPRDRRSVLVVPTAAGRAYLSHLRRFLSDAARPCVSRSASDMRRQAVRDPIEASHSRGSGQKSAAHAAGISAAVPG